MWYEPSDEPDDEPWKEKSFWVKDFPNSTSVTHEVGKFLISPKFKGYTMIAHNMKAFDGCFLLRYMTENGLTPRPIFSGKKIMSLEVRPLKIRIIDSLNFLPMPLAAFEKAFGLEEAAKGYFPHFFAKPENYNYKGPLPPKDDYGCDGMKTEAREIFIKWHNDQTSSGVQFDFENDIAKYCRQDVQVLVKGCLAFKNLLMQLTDNTCDPFQYTTLASVSSTIFKGKYMKPESIAAVPPNGYADVQNFSSCSLEWLEWQRQMKGVSNLKHIANSSLGEAKVGNYRADGVDVENKILFEFYGCYYHGCPKCFPNRNLLNKNRGKTFETLHNELTDRELFLCLMDWEVRTIWECEWKKMKDENPEIQNFVNQNKTTLTPMNPFDSFFGGRVETFKMCVNDERLMNYEDVTSLYPFINATAEYPVGHPEVILSDFGDLETICDRFFGFMKCTILPPKKLYIPVLPGKFGQDQKLLFPLCRVCAENREPEKHCAHNEDERSLTGTWFIR